MRLHDVEAAVREIVAGLEPEEWAPEAAAGLVDMFATIEKLAGAGRGRRARVASGSFRAPNVRRSRVAADAV
jgi:hypothetical protein